MPPKCDLSSQFNALFNMTPSLFDLSLNPPVNLLPKDGTALYYGQIISTDQADDYLATFLKSIPWQSDEAIIFGKKIQTKRAIAWFGEHPFRYTYSQVTKYALPWTEGLLALKRTIEKKSAETYNSCLMNLYHDGSEGMAWHSDGEKDLKQNGAIASVSLGAERKFAFKHKKTAEVVHRVLPHGSLLVMKGTCQQHWLHRLPPTKTSFGPRINLTFRTITGQF